jgi:hypothetical protein
MDFRVTHFLSGTAVTADNAQVAGASSVTANALSVVQMNGSEVGVSVAGSNVTAGCDVLQFWQGLDINDPIQKELRYIKSGKIKRSNILSVKKLAGSTSKNEMVKFIGPSMDTSVTTLANYQLATEVGDAVAVWGNADQVGLLIAATGFDTNFSSTNPCASLNLSCGQEFSLTVRAQSALANTISPFGLTKTYTRMVNCCNNCSDTFFKSAYDTVAQVMTDLATDPVMSAYVKASYIYGWYLTTSGAKAYFKIGYNVTTKSFASTPIAAAYVPGNEEVIGEDFVIGIVLEGVAQPNWKNTADITLFPFRKDAVKFFAQTFVGPMAASNPHNGGTQEPLLVADMCDKGQTYTINFAFPRLTGEEVRHIEHEYATYSQKYGQRFQGVKYNALAFPSFIPSGNENVAYTLYYIEYLPIVDNSYTSTQEMTQLTIIALPSSLTSEITAMDALFTDAVADLGLAQTVVTLSTTDTNPYA